MIDEEGRIQVTDQTALPPRERLDTLPGAGTDRPFPELTLGWGVIQWIADNLTHPFSDGARGGKPYRLTMRQMLFMLWFYELREATDDHGNTVYVFVHDEGVRRLVKNSGKTPFSAVHAIVELLGPVAFDHLDPNAPGGAVGRPVDSPLIWLAAGSFDHAKYIMEAVRQFVHSETEVYRRYLLSVGQTQITTPSGGRMMVVANSPTKLEGPRPSFVVCDETEHWTPSAQGDELKAVIDRNAKAKRGRVLQTCNAWTPGRQSVAEDTFDAWCLQEDGELLKSTRTLYDAVIAPPNTSLTDDPDEGDIALSTALEFLYRDPYWQSLEKVRSMIWSPTTTQEYSRIYYLNQPSSGSRDWIGYDDWMACATQTGRTPEDGEEIVMFLDGSSTGDHTALVGVCLRDGHVFTIGIWKPEYHDGVWEIDRAAVMAEVEVARERFDVVAFWADTREWIYETSELWPRLFAGERLIPPPGAKKGEMHTVAYNMATGGANGGRREYSMSMDITQREVLAKAFTHDGDKVLAQHVSNVRPGRVGGLSWPEKESKKSPRKIDGAVAMIGARMAYRFVSESPDYQKRKRQGTFRLTAGDW